MSPPFSPHRFNTQPPEGGCKFEVVLLSTGEFQHTAARRRLTLADLRRGLERRFNTQPPEGGCAMDALFGERNGVSTHSRPKAAVHILRVRIFKGRLFQHTAARRRLNLQALSGLHSAVSTHSRPKAAAVRTCGEADGYLVSTHSRPKAAE